MDIYNLINRPPEQKATAENADIKPIPESLWHDSQVRHSIEHAVRLEDKQLIEITKMLESANIQQLDAIRLDRPFMLPNACGNSYGSNNEILKEFAFTVYDQLSSYFTSESWSGWFLAPYFANGDDLRESFNLGLFIDEKFIETVVE